MQSNDKKVLLRISHLKQYFPLRKSLGKEQLYVKANDDISVNIYEGETLGLVGESGCGKSTFGRVLLQLYHQTDGKTMYYGRTLDSLAPNYVKATLKNLEKRRAIYREKEKVKNTLVSGYETLGEKAKRAKKGERDKAVTEAYDAYLDIAQLIGGFIISENLSEVSKVFLEKYQAAADITKLEVKRNKYVIALNMLTGKATDKKKKGQSTASVARRIEAIEKKVAEIETKLTATKQLLDKAKDKIAIMRKVYEGNADFAANEEFYDDGIDLAKLKYHEMRRLRKDLQLIFQDPYSSLNPRMTVGQIIGEGLVAHKFFKKNDDKMQDYVMKVMEDCGLAPYMIHRYPHQFSGGQRQRIGIARSLAMKPKFVVCDEAVSALDVSIQSQVINLLEDLKQVENLTYLFISHDLSVVKYISDRIGVMYLGNIVELAEAEDIFKEPLHPYTDALLLAIPTTDVAGRGEIVPLEGDIPSPVKPPSGCKFHTRCKLCTDICKEVIPDFVELRPGHFVACHHPLDGSGNLSH